MYSLFAVYLDLTAWILWPALLSVWTLIPSTIPLILLLQTLRDWSSSTSWIHWWLLSVCQTLFCNQIVCLVLLTPKFTVSFQFLFISVLFPFMGPVFEMMNVSFFPAEVMNFFYNFLKKIKSERNKNNCKVIQSSYNGFYFGCWPIFYILYS